MRTARTLLVCALLGACTETPTGPEGFAPAFGRGNGPSYVATNWQGRVWSNGPIPAGIDPDGRFTFDAGGNAKNAAPELCVDLSEPGGVGIADQATYDLFLQRVAADPTSNGLSQVCSQVAVHSRDHSNPEQPGGQTIGSVEHAGGKIVLKDFDTGAGGNGGWEWRLIWDVEGPLMNDPERGRGICIERLAPEAWNVYNDDDVAVDPPSGCIANGGTVDNVARLIRVYGDRSQGGRPISTFVLVAEFRLPFRFSFVAQ
jgi:hypothetical protein